MVGALSDVVHLMSCHLGMALCPCKSVAPHQLLRCYIHIGRIAIEVAWDSLHHVAWKVIPSERLRFTRRMVSFG